MKWKDVGPGDIRDGIVRAGDHPIVEQGARIGYLASGLLHFLICWLALRLAWGSYGGEADQTQAFDSVSGNAAGNTLLVVIAAAFVLLGLWNITEVFLVKEISDRLKHAAKGLVYAALAWGAIEVIGERRSSGAEKSEDATATMMGNPAGDTLIVLVGIGVIAVGAYLVYKGVRRKYREDLVDELHPLVEVLAAVGYGAKGVSLALVGGLFIAAVVTNDPGKASGMDGALRTLLDLPYGPWLLTLAAVGLFAYGVYSLVRAKFAKV